MFSGNGDDDDDETLKSARIAVAPNGMIDAYAWQEDPEAGVLLLDVFWGGKKKTISFTEEELLESTQDGRNRLREKVEKNIVGKKN